MIKKVKENLRLAVQIAFTAVTNGYVLGFFKGKIYQGNLKTVCVPGLNCYSCPGALGSCPIGSLQAILGGGERKFPFYVVGTLMIIGASLGRFVCGWLCPFGLVQDLLHKIPVFKRIKRKSLPGHHILKYLKYVVLVVFVILLPMFALDFTGRGNPWFCKYICPSGTIMGGWPLVAMNEGLLEAVGFLFAWKSVLLICIIVLSIIVYRPFCKYLCPLGGIYGFFNPIAFYRLEVDEKKCTKCGKCVTVCPMDIDVYKNPNSMECIRCGKCKKSCPTSAINAENILKRGVFK